MHGNDSGKTYDTQVHVQITRAQTLEMYARKRQWETYETVQYGGGEEHVHTHHEEV